MHPLPGCKCLQAKQGAVVSGTQFRTLHFLVDKLQGAVRTPKNNRSKTVLQESVSHKIMDS
eukprot:5737371-Amphidinium_carterae.1